ncbi:flagellar hook-length control protein FliK [Marinomonas agarivorans]|nr:flagellar hook-length control protein FliK [Marinomonas agarivorans]
MRPSSDVSILSLGQSNKIQKAPPRNTASDRGFHDVMREANASAERPNTNRADSNRADSNRVDSNRVDSNRVDSNRVDSHADKKADNVERREQSADRSSPVEKASPNQKDSTESQTTESSTSEKNTVAQKDQSQKQAANDKSTDDKNHTADAQHSNETTESTSSADTTLRTENTKSSSVTSEATTSTELSSITPTDHLSMGEQSKSSLDGKALQIDRPNDAALNNMVDSKSEIEATTSKNAADFASLSTETTLSAGAVEFHDVESHDIAGAAGAELAGDSARAVGLAKEAEIALTDSGQQIVVEESVQLLAGLSPIDETPNLVGEHSQNPSVQTEAVKAKAAELNPLTQAKVDQDSLLMPSADEKTIDLSAQLAGAAQNLSSMVSGKEGKKANTADTVDAIKASAKEGNASLSEMAHNLEAGVEDSVELDWVLQQMASSENQGVDPKSGLKAELAAATVKSGFPVSNMALQNPEAKNANFQPLDLANSNSVDKSAELLDNVLLNTEGGELEFINKDQLSSRATINDVAVSGGLSGTAQAINAKMAPLNLMAGAPNASIGASLTMQVPPTHPDWGNEMGDKLMWMTKQGVHKAEIHLDPPELGSLTVKVSVDADTASVSFVVASTQVKDLLDGQAQRLREMLAQQNINLDAVDVDVSRQGAGSNGSAAGNTEGHVSNLESDQSDSALEDVDVPMNVGHVSSNRVDFYA